MIIMHIKYSLLVMMLLYNAKFYKNNNHSLNIGSYTSPIIEKSFYNIVNYSIYINNVENKIGLITLRKFTDIKNRIDYAIVLDTKTLKTYIYNLKDLKIAKISNISKNTNYSKLINLIVEKNYKTSGIDSIFNDGYSLTLDLCPSAKKFDSDFFNYIIEKNVNPIYICVSGKWIDKHNSELKYILNYRNNNNIIWVNHSYSHYYDSKKKNNNNFMLSENTNLDFEVLNNEITMLKNGIIPSPFFRFPGLISDQKICKKIISYGLIPLSSNTWFAKGQKPKNRSIILLHMNGNERNGLTLFLKFFENTKLKPTSIF